MRIIPRCKTAKDITRCFNTVHNRVVELRHQGNSFRQIAEAVGYHEATVARICRLRGIAPMPDLRRAKFPFDVLDEDLLARFVKTYRPRPSAPKKVNGRALRLFMQRKISIEYESVLSKSDRIKLLLRLYYGYGIKFSDIVNHFQEFKWSISAINTVLTRTWERAWEQEYARR